ncbi:TcpE family conjugal transfer membrane protein [Priestia megaterium]|uniref:TcpE family conjugal transfer membrane protein n=1 Tax=Priestia megaterium TaxID=1404 RepID=UPI0036701840
MEPYNFKRTFNDPITLYTIGKFTLPFGIGLMRAVLFLLVFGLMFLFRGFFLAIGGIIPGLTLVLYGGIPFVVSHYLLKKDPQGKKLLLYLYDLIVYFFGVYLPKKKYANDTEIAYQNERHVTFEDLPVPQMKINERDGDKHEIANTNQDDLQEYDVNKVG